MKRIIFMLGLSLVLVVMLNLLYPADAPEIVIEKEPFEGEVFESNYTFYDAEVVVELSGSAIFRKLTNEPFNLFHMFTEKNPPWDSGVIVAIADSGSQFDCYPPIKRGKVELREKRPGMPKVWYEILAPMIEKDVENGVELIIFDLSETGNIEEKEWVFMKFAGMLPVDENGRATIYVDYRETEEFESVRQGYEAEKAVCYEIITRDEAEDFFRFSVKKYEDTDDFKEYNGKARLKNGKWQYKMGLWWKTVEN
ncbi:MAG: hypothetical protein IJO16_03615 [Clostridia bacterium]|nr:hypothetical protein [Clostridia bacterium]